MRLENIKRSCNMNISISIQIESKQMENKDYGMKGIYSKEFFNNLFQWMQNDFCYIQLHCDLNFIYLKCQKMTLGFMSNPISRLSSNRLVIAEKGVCSAFIFKGKTFGWRTPEITIYIWLNHPTMLFFRSFLLQAYIYDNDATSWIENNGILSMIFYFIETDNLNE